MDNAGKKECEVRQTDIDDDNARERGTTESICPWIGIARILAMHVARRGD
jgi:hypothetical protein